MNKSSKYVFPSVFFKLVEEEGESGNIASHLKDTFLVDSDNKFVIVLNHKNNYTDEMYSEEKIELIKKCPSVTDLVIAEDEIRIKVALDDSFNDLIRTFAESKYSEIPENFKTDILDYNFTYKELEDYIKIGYILYKNEILRDAMAKNLQINKDQIPQDMELESIVDMDSELYRG